MQYDSSWQNLLRNLATSRWGLGVLMVPLVHIFDWNLAPFVLAGILWTCGHACVAFVLNDGTYATWFVQARWVEVRALLVYAVFSTILTTLVYFFRAVIMLLKIADYCTGALFGENIAAIIVLNHATFSHSYNMLATSFGIKRSILLMLWNATWFLIGLVGQILSLSSKPLALCFSKDLPTPEHDSSFYKHHLIGADEIRLLKINRKLPFTRLRTEMFTSTRSAAPPYEAISYTWGTSTERRGIIVNDKSLEISAATYDALRARSSIWRTRLVWIDAICINQDDLEEKAIQVQQMFDIYRRAQEVIVYLGSSPLAWIALWQTHDILAFDDTGASASEMYEWYEKFRMNPTWEVFLNLFLNPWFTRVWVIQEAAAGRKVKFLYNGVSMHWDRFDRLTKIFVDPIMTTLIQKTTTGEHAKMNIINFRKIRSVREEVQEDQDPEIVAKRNFIDKIVHYDLTSLPVLLTTHVSFEATDQRDKIYALQSLGASGTTKPHLLPDYTKPVEQVYIDQAKEIWSQPRPFDIIASAGIGHERSLALPSWVADWSRPHIAPALTRPGWADQWFETGYRAAVELKASVQVNLQSDDNSLGVQGFKVDEIAALSSVSKRSSDDEEYLTDSKGGVFVAGDWIEHHALHAEVFNLAMSDLVTGSPQTRQDILWRTLIGDRDDDYRPAPANLYAEYTHWVNMHEFMLPYVQARGKIDFPTTPEFFKNLENMSTWNRLLGGAFLGRRFCITKKGRMGLVPPESVIGDPIYIVAGARTPWILRDAIAPLSTSAVDSPSNLASILADAPTNFQSSDDDDNNHTASVNDENNVNKFGEKVASNGPASHYNLVGECFVYGMMDSEMLEEGQVAEITII